MTQRGNRCFAKALYPKSVPRVRIPASSLLLEVPYFVSITSIELIDILPSHNLSHKMSQSFTYVAERRIDRSAFADGTDPAQRLRSRPCRSQAPTVISKGPWNIFRPANWAEDEASFVLELASRFESLKGRPTDCPPLGAPGEGVLTRAFKPVPFQRKSDFWTVSGTSEKFLAFKGLAKWPRTFETKFLTSRIRCDYQVFPDHRALSVMPSQSEGLYHSVTS
jgi:hypothetical protein